MSQPCVANGNDRSPPCCPTATPSGYRRLNCEPWCGSGRSGSPGEDKRATDPDRRRSVRRWHRRRRARRRSRVHRRGHRRGAGQAGRGRRGAGHSDRAPGPGGGRRCAAGLRRRVRRRSVRHGHRVAVARGSCRQSAGSLRMSARGAQRASGVAGRRRSGGGGRAPTRRREVRHRQRSGRLRPHRGPGSRRPCPHPLRRHGRHLQGRRALRQGGRHPRRRVRQGPGRGRLAVRRADSGRQLAGRAGPVRAAQRRAQVVRGRGGTGLQPAAPAASARAADQLPPALAAP